MTNIRMFRWTSPLMLALALLPAACAQQPGGMRGQQSGGSSGQPSGGMSGMNMPSHDMSGMDMQTMMNNCAQMRQETGQGAAMSPDMQSMMARCNQMDQQMGGVPSSGASAPRTRTR